MGKRIAELTDTTKKRYRFLVLTWAPLWGSGSGKFISRWAGGENKRRPLDGDGSYQRATIQKLRDRGEWAHHNQNGCSLYGDILSDELKTTSAPLTLLVTLI
ncbi:hypothetical protein, partial [Serratia ureilytica]|uniref:hypothetical protein n=1 Tax=Serratia ureilytica TaxID=300181 RepID=UPI003F60E534